MSSAGRGQAESGRGVMFSVLGRAGGGEHRAHREIKVVWKSGDVEEEMQNGKNWDKAQKTKRCGCYPITGEDPFSDLKPEVKSLEDEGRKNHKEEIAKVQERHGVCLH